MNRIMDLLDSEPVLTRVGPVVGAIVIYLLAKGLIDQDTANLFVGLAVAVVGSGAAFSARALVRPWPPAEGPDHIRKVSGSGSDGE